MELISKQAIAAFKENNFILEPALSPITGKEENRKLESTHYVKYKGIAIMQIQENDNGTFNVFEHLQYAITFSKNHFNIILERAIEIAQRITELNQLVLDDVQLTLF